MSGTKIWVEDDLQRFAIALVVAALMASAAAQKPASQKAGKKGSATAASLPQGPTLAEKIQQIASRPVFRHSLVGIEVYDATDHKILAALNEEKLFTSGSTTKLITEGTALALLGENYRFHTRVYHTGTLNNDGTLEGDLVLVAGGDPNLSGRVKLDDTLDYTSSDHSYAGVTMATPVYGEPLRVFKELASGVLMKGVARVHGRVIVDASIFPSDQLEPATHTTISPMMLNDNVIDVTAISGELPGEAAAIKLSPDVGYLRVINRLRTGRVDSEPMLQFTSDTTEPDGSHTVIVEGTVPAGKQKVLAVYKVKDPVLFATMGFRDALRWASIPIQEPSPAPLIAANAVPAMASPSSPQAAASAATAARSAPSNARSLLVEHDSPPFREEVRLTLKVSQNLHAATTPYLVGSLLGHGSNDAAQRGLALEHRFLSQAGLEPETVSQLDGEGGIGSAFSPDFMVRYLGYMARQPYGKAFFDSLPVLGHDGTLTEMMQNSPAAGHVHAKTGSYSVANNLDGGVMLMGKGLAGYIDAANGHQLIFAAFVNLVPLRNMEQVADVGQTLAEVAATAYQYAPPLSAAPKPALQKAPGKKKSQK